MKASFLQAGEDGILLQIKVVPRSSLNAIGECIGDRLKIKIAAPPVDSEANIALIKFLSKRLGCQRSDVVLLAGHRSRSKNLLIKGIEFDDLAARLGVAGVNG